ncbi:hypothetical protein [Streptomyces sp. BK205]|uniref:hypothetical protein n=1 Tax=Streptomyces sp. BK205 TaxID=2512164 RepID=UPI00104C0B66|nr:hypothetical protein [Streptomyces sp. BK205]TCR26264.1 hypothetical protein EV578_101211 [Streptomyces sp. BK205]
MGDAAGAEPTLGLGLFAAVDQAMLLDELPERGSDAYRFLGIVGFATAIPQSVAPLVASGILLIGATEGTSPTRSCSSWQPF